MARKTEVQISYPPSDVITAVKFAPNNNQFLIYWYTSSDTISKEWVQCHNHLTNARLETYYLDRIGKIWTSKRYNCRSKCSWTKCSRSITSMDSRFGEDMEPTMKKNKSERVDLYGKFIIFFWRK